jgi:hypothetical protein
VDLAVTNDWGHNLRRDAAIRSPHAVELVVACKRDCRVILTALLARTHYVEHDRLPGLIDGAHVYE